MGLPSGYVNNNNSLNNFSVYGGISEDELKKQYERAKKEEYKNWRKFYSVCFIISIVVFVLFIVSSIIEGEINDYISDIFMGIEPLTLAAGIVSWALYKDMTGFKSDNVIFMLSIASKEVKSGVSLSKETSDTSTNSAVTYYLLVDNYGDAFLCANESLYNEIEPNVNYFVVMNKQTNCILSILKVNS